MNPSPQHGPATSAARADRQQAVRQRDAAQVRVRRLTIGAMTLSLAAATVGAVILGTPSTPSTPAPAAASGQTAASATVTTNGKAGVTVARAAQAAPVAVTGGS